MNENSCVWADKRPSENDKPEFKAWCLVVLGSDSFLVASNARETGYCADCIRKGDHACALHAFLLTEVEVKFLTTVAGALIVQH